MLAADWADLPDRSPAGEAQANAHSLGGAQQRQLLGEQRGDRPAWGGRWEERLGEAKPLQLNEVVEPGSQPRPKLRM